MGLSTTYTKTETDFLIQQLEEKTSDKYNDESNSIANDIIKFIDINTGENVTYRKTTTWYDGSAMTDVKADGVMFIKKSGKYYKREFEGFINVKWFGAKGDGVTDDTEAIQKALDNCYGNTLFFPSSESGNQYVVTDTLIVKYNLNSKNGILMDSGGSQRSAIKPVGFAKNQAIFKFSNIIVGYNIKGLVISGTGKNGNAIVMEKCRGFRIKDIFCKGINKPISYGVDSYYNVMKDFEFYDCEYGLCVEAGYPMGSFKVSDGKITKCKYAFYSDGNCNDIVFTSVDLEGCEYKVFSNLGEATFRDCYFGDESRTPVVVKGGFITIDNPQSYIGAALSNEFHSNDDTIYRQGVLLEGGVLKITNSTIGGNFIDSTNNSGNCLGSSIKVQGGKLIGNNLKFAKSEKNVIDTISVNNVYLDEFKNYVKNGNFRDDISAVVNEFNSEGYEIASEIELLNKENGSGGKILRIKPSNLPNKHFGIQIPYSIDNIKEVKFLRLKFNVYKNFTEAETANILSKIVPSITSVNSTQFSNEDAELNGFIMSYPTNQNWAGYHFLKKVTSTNSFNSDFVQEVVYPLILNQKQGFIRLANFISLSSSNTLDTNFIDFGLDIHHIALLDKLGGDAVCQYTNGFLQ